jgi:transcriptional regulator of heat shock response
MSLNKRQRLLLYYLIRYCIIRQKPVGSKILSKKIKKRFAASTIRLYLRKLASEGYIENVGSAGRLPSDKGWYYYLRNYELYPEIDIPDRLNLNLISNLTKNIVFLYDKILTIKGLKNIVYIKNKEIIEDMLYIVENLEKIIHNLNNDINILIGEKLQESKTKKLSLLAYKNKDKIFGFLGQKINYYHANLALLKKIQNG